jgi:hypothetical protein
MFSRRQLMGGGGVSALLGILGAREASAGSGVAAVQQRGRDEEPLVADAVDRLRDELRVQRTFGEIAVIRDAQKTFLRQNGKLPDYMDVGADVWFAAYDWHIRWQQPITLGRDATGRLTLQMLQTAIVLRPDTASSFTSLPYDIR